MAIASITEWLKSKSKTYLHGKVLYMQYGNKQHLKTLFNSGNSSFHFQKLEIALNELNLLNSPPPKQIIIAEPPKPKVLEEKAVMDYKNSPDKIKEIIAVKNKSYALARSYFTTIPFMDSQEHRKEAAKELLKEMEFVQDCWQAIDEWQKNGNIRDLKLGNLATEINGLTTAQLMAEARNLPPNISKDKGKLAICDNPKKQLILDNRIKERLERLTLVKQRLNELI